MPLHAGPQAQCRAASSSQQRRAESSTQGRKLSPAPQAQRRAASSTQGRKLNAGPQAHCRTNAEPQAQCRAAGPMQCRKPDAGPQAQCKGRKFSAGPQAQCRAVSSTQSQEPSAICRARAVCSTWRWKSTKSCCRGSQRSLTSHQLGCSCCIAQPPKLLTSCACFHPILLQHSRPLTMKGCGGVFAGCSA